MPQVNWDAFAKLPGAATTNFEMLCRALIRKHFARFGSFGARALQPGVEFHLRIERASQLGDAGRWFGWQCRWYDLPGGTALGKTRRDKIAKAINTTERELPGVTDWVLWTRRPLTAGDQKWCYGLDTRMKLHLWTATEVEEFLIGDAEILKATYFGELVFSPDELAARHAAAVATVRGRWLSEVHQPVEVERDLRRMLGEVGGWEALRYAEEALRSDAKEIERANVHAPAGLASRVASIPVELRACADALATVASALGAGDLDLVRQVTVDQATSVSPDMLVLPRQLRAARSAAALPVTDGLASLRAAGALLSEVEESIGVRAVAVVADAGGGKTHLCAQLAAPLADRPAGILLFGRDLHARDNLNDLTRRSIAICGIPVLSIEALLAAIDAAGQRAHRRIPLLIDGLNEAEDARDWKAPLSALEELLRGYPYVLAVVTVRGAFADEALPPGMRRLEMTGFDGDLRSAALRYFRYFKIDWRDAELPFELLRHPLTLRLFCEVTNPKREGFMGIEKGPRSLSALFDRYLEMAYERIASLAPRTHRYYEHDVRNAVDEVGRLLWEGRARAIPRRVLQARLSDQGRPWDESLVRALEHEGVLLAQPGESPGDPHEAIMYDALAGHVIANHVVGTRGRDRLKEWLNSPDVVTALSSSQNDCLHPLASDIFVSLVALVPRRAGREQLWQLAPDVLRLPALREAAELEGADLDAATIHELEGLVVSRCDGAREILLRLARTRGVVGHPLNAQFLDRVLRGMAVAQRDARWTEWIRRNEGAIRKELEMLEEGWRTILARGQSDELRAKWVSWICTSTVRRLRDEATRALYWFGRGDLGALLALAANALSVNDPYVTERVAAAAYGAVMAQQPSAASNEPLLQKFLQRIGEELVGATAAHPTGHWFVRMYLDGIFAYASKFCPGSVPQAWRGLEHIPFAPGASVDPIPDGDARAEEVDQTLGMDFRNYTLGRLVEGRRNYDMEHSGHVAAVAHTRGVVWSLGWRKAEFGATDRDLASGVSRGERAEVERYGKKYGWCGYYTYAGVLDDEDRLPDRGERLSSVDIDPSFPEDPRRDPLEMEDWATQFPGDDKSWLVRADIRLPREFFYRRVLGSSPVGWIAVYAFLNTRERLQRRSVFGFLTGMLVAEKDLQRLVKALKTREYPGNHWLPEPPTDYYSFAGEFPWHRGVGTYSGGEVARYTHEVEVGDGEPVAIEALAHEYGWETYHSELNKEGGAAVPSVAFSRAFDLRPVPNGFDQVEQDGSLAAISWRAPEGLSGRVLYIREDLLKKYAAGRQLVWFAWGERELKSSGYIEPRAWVREAIQRHEIIWRVTRVGSSLVPSFSPSRKGRRRRPMKKQRKR